jgi:uncharacterized membrane protein SpoIIM required for sporulation
MNLVRFTSEREPLWRELDALVAASKGKAARLIPQDVLRLGRLYRAAAADLAFARRRWPGEPVVVRLDHLVNRARVLVYGAPAKSGGLVAFFSRDYWRRLVEAPAFLFLAAFLLLAPAGASTAWAMGDPAAAINFVPEQFQPILERDTPGEDAGLTPGEEAAFSSSLFTNNIGVTFLAFAGGVLIGLGAAWILGFNGALLGAVTGLAVGAGNGPVLAELVVPHGVLELSCIVVTGAAGLRLGWAILAPGHRRRVDAAVEEGRRGVEVVLGTMPWLVIAGLIEGFVRGAGLGLVVNSIVGFGLGGLFWGLAFLLGRERAEPATGQTRALAFARR